MALSARRLRRVGCRRMPAYDLNGKVALVTGAARGIGYETARQMHLRGASVAVVDLDADQAREAAERIGERAIGLAADVTDQGAMLQRSPRRSSASAASTSPSPTPGSRRKRGDRPGRSAPRSGSGSSTST